MHQCGACTHLVKNFYCLLHQLSVVWLVLERHFDVDQADSNTSSFQQTLQIETIALFTEATNSKHMC